MWGRAGGRLVALRRFSTPSASSWVPQGSWQLEFRTIGTFSGSGIVPTRILRDKDISDEFGITTGLEREELEYKKKGLKRFDMDAPEGPFGTKEHPAIVQSYFDERIVGCPGGVGDDEHDVVWFHLRKGERYECPVCAQVFELEVVGEGGPPH